MGGPSPQEEAAKAQHRRSSPKRANGNDVTSPPPKRQRVYVACEHCRLRKQKCDSKRPACSTCIATNQQCVYGAGVKKRGLPPGYVRVLETLFGLIFSKIAHGEEAVAALLLKSGVVTRQWALGKADDGNDIILQRFKKSHICKSIERLLEGEARDSSDSAIPWNPALSDEAIEQLDWKEFCGNDGNDGPEMIDAEETRQRTVSKLGRKPTRDEDGYAFQVSQLFRLPLEIRAPLYVELLSKSPAWLRATAIRGSCIHLRLPGNTWTLLDIYFTWTNCWLPIISRQEILKTFHSYESGDVRLELESADAGKHAILWAVIAHASFQERAATQSKEKSLTPDTLSCHQIYETARSLVPAYLSSYQRGHVEALIILALINCGSGQKLIARELIGQAVRIGDLSQDSSAAALATRGTEFSIKDDGIMMGCFVLDTVLSYGLGQPSHFAEQSTLDIGTMDTDRLEEYEPWFDRTKLQGSSSSDSRRGPQYSFTMFNQLIKITRILHKYHRAKMSHTSRLSSRESSPVLEELRSWSAALPSTCQLPIPLSEAQKLQVTPQLLNLHIMYRYVGQCIEAIDAKLASLPPDFSNTQPDKVDSSLASLLSAYNDIFGCVTMPSTFSQMVKSACQRQGLLQPFGSRLQETLAKLHKVWRDEFDPLPVLPQHLQEQIEQSSTESPYFLPTTSAVPPNSEETVDQAQPSPALLRTPSVVENQNSSTGDRRGNDELINHSISYQGTSSHKPMTRLDLPDSTPNETPLSTHAHITVPEDTLYPISPMSIDTTFKRPEQPASASNRDFSTEFLASSHNTFQPQIQGFPHVSQDFAHPNHSQQHEIYDTQYSGPYNSTSGIMGTNSLLGSNYDLDQLFNDLAPLDHGDKYGVFMLQGRVSSIC